MLGEGIYTLSEVSRFTRLHPTTLRSWFKGRADGAGRGALFTTDHPPVDGDYAVSFLNLIEAHVAQWFKGEGVKTPVIRLTHTILKKKLSTPHPFAHAKLATDGVRIIQEDLSDAITEQLMFPEFEKRLSRIEYDVTTRLAEAWKIADGVIIKPDVSFGKPIIENAGVSTLILARQYRANGENARLVAKLFDITENGVMDAYRFERNVTRRVA